MKIVSIKQAPTETVYDVCVPGAHHYILKNGVITHNSGLKYAASSIAFLSKAQDKDPDGERRGSIITVTMDKSRFSREKTKVKTRLTFAEGLDRYYGLIDMAINAGVWSKDSKKIVTTVGTVFESLINKNPTKYYTKEVLDGIEKYVNTAFAFGSDAPQVEGESDATDEPE